VSNEAYKKAFIAKSNLDHYTRRMHKLEKAKNEAMAEIEQYNKSTTDNLSE
jgi:hypothetical protein